MSYRSVLCVYYWLLYCMMWYVGLYEKAEPLYVDCLQRTRVSLGENHPSTLTYMHNLAGLYENQGKSSPDVYT